MVSMKPTNWMKGRLWKEGTRWRVERRDGVEVVVVGVYFGVEVREESLIGDGGAGKCQETGSAPAKATPTEQKRKA